MKTKKTLVRRIILSVFSVCLLCALLFGIRTVYQSKRHRCVSTVESITVYPHAENENIYRVEIKGTLKNWFYDNTVHENVTLVGYYGGGEPKYSRFESASDTLTVSKEKSDFSVILDVDASSKVWGDMESFVRCWQFRLSDESENPATKQAFFVEDFDDVPIVFAEAKPVSNSLLDTDTPHSISTP